MAFYQPPEHISALLDKRVKIAYKEVIEAGAKYHISYSRDGNATKASVSFLNNSWRGTALYELEFNNNSYHWYMVRDWSD